MSIWHEGLELGHAEIDKQHEELFRRMEILVDTCVAGEAARSVDEILDYMDEYARTHFRTEEELMLRHKYPGYQFHKEQHGIFRGHVESLRKQALQRRKSSDMALQINQMLIEWFRDHILNLDKTAVAFLADRHDPK